jgi:hypothetical protein
MCSKRKEGKYSGIALGKRKEEKTDRAFYIINTPKRERHE